MNLSKLQQVFKILFVTLAFLISCGKSPTEDTNDLKTEFQLKGTISGVVIDENEIPLSGVSATLDSAGYDSQTSSDGKYTIPDVPKGLYSITFTKTGYSDKTVYGVGIVEDEELVIQNVTMVSEGLDSLLNYGEFKGSVTDSLSGMSLAGVSVTIGKKSSTSDSIGAVLVGQIPAGTYSIQFAKSGCINKTLDSIIIAANEITELSAVELFCTEDADQWGYVKGFVIDSSKQQPLSGIVITTKGGKTTSSEKDGSFLISQVAEGTTSLTYSSDIYKDVVVNDVVVLRNDTTHVDSMYLVRTLLNVSGKLEGTVDFSGSLANIQVQAVPLVSAGLPLAGVTNSLGKFEIVELPIGQYIVKAIGDFVSDPDTIEIFQDSTTIVDLKNVVRDQAKLPRTIAGSITEGLMYGDNSSQLSSIDSIIVILSGDELTSPEVTQLAWLSTSKVFTGTVYVPASGLEWNAEVRVFDSAKKLIAIGNIDFDSKSGDVELAAMDVWNAYPDARSFLKGPKLDDVVSINDTVFLMNEAIDGKDSGTISKIEWQAEGELAWKIVTGNSSTIAPSTPNNQWQVKSRVTDNDGNSVVKTLTMEVVEDKPSNTIINTSGLSPLIGKSHDFITTIQDENHGEIVKYEWDFGSGFVELGDSVSFTFNTMGSDTIYCRVTDDDGNDSMAVFTFNVKGEVTDSRDGMIYKTVKMGNQVWLAENLKYTPTSSNASQNTSCYDNVSANCDKYGRLYDWVTAMDIDSSFLSNSYSGSLTNVQGICPTGMHLPDSNDINELLTFLPSTGHGNHLRSKTGGWNEYYYNGLNYWVYAWDTYSFNALPSGIQNNQGDFLWGENHVNQGALWQSTGKVISVTSNYSEDIQLLTFTDKKRVKTAIRCLND